MGIINYGDYGVPSFDVSHVTESYDILGACSQLMVEAVRNEREITGALMQIDYTEEAAGHGLVSESFFEDVLNEGVSDAFAKVKEFAKKAWEKIKEIIQAIITRIQSFFIKDGKKLISKYGKTVAAKVNTGRVSKMKFKWKEIDNAISGKEMENLFTEALSDMKDDDKLVISAKTSSSPRNGNGYTSSIGNGLNSSDIEKQYNGKVFSFDEEKYRSYSSSEQEDIVAAYCKAVHTGSTTIDELKKDIKDNWFKDEEEKEGVTSDIHRHIVDVLTNNKKNLSDLDKNKKAVDTKAKEVQRAIDDIQKTVDKDLKETNASAASKLAGVLCSRASFRISTIQQVSGATFSTISQCIKDEFSQSRSLFLKILNHGKDDRKIDESAIDEINENEVNEMMFGNFTESAFTESAIFE